MVKQGYSRFLSLLEFFCDVVGIAMAFFLTQHFFQTEIPSTNQAFWFIAFLILLIFFWNKLYDKHKTILNIEETRLILKSLITAALIVFTLLFFSEESRNPDPTSHLSFLDKLRHHIFNAGFNKDLSRIELLSAFVLMFPLIGSLRYFVFKLGQHLHRKGIGNDRVLIYGNEELARHLCEKIKQSPKSGYFLVGIIADKPLENVNNEKIPYLGNAAQLETLCKEQHIDRLIVADANMNSDRLVEIMRLAEKIKVELEFVPALHTLFVHRIRLRDIDGLPLISLHNSSKSPLKKISKYLFDMILSLLLLIIVSPLMLLIAISIRLQKDGPVFFTQKRSGLNGKLFTVIKFRTMASDTKKYAPTPTSSNETRITTLGKWLRRSSLDELPQLFNVLQGEMSLVGPRPEMSFITDKYGPLEKERLRIKPGITGLWQISADRQQQIHDNLDYDLYYIEHQSVLLDIVILMRTIFSVIRGIGSY